MMRLSGIARDTAFGDIPYECDQAGHVTWDEGFGEVERCPVTNKWALLIRASSLYEGSKDRSRRRAIERGLREMLGYIL